MTRYLSATKVERDFSISIEDLMKIEEEDPLFDLVREYARMGDKYRISFCNRLCRCIGTTWAEFVDDGFSYNDLAEVLGDQIQSLGFSDNSATNLDSPSESVSGPQ